MEKPAKIVQLKTQLVKEGHTRTMLAETDLMTLRIHCYAPGIGENALHSHTKEDHIFLVLQGTAQFNTGRDGQTVLRAGDENLVLVVHRLATDQGSPAAQAVPDRMSAALKQLSFRACYCSALDKCWISELKTTETTPVAVCPKADHPFAPAAFPAAFAEASNSR